MLATKYLFIPFLYSIVNSSPPYKTIDNSALFELPPLEQLYGGNISLYLPKYRNPFQRKYAKRRPLPHQHPHKLSFLDMQRKTAQDTASEPAGPIETLIQYKAQDSIVFDVQQKLFHLHGAGDIGYKDMKLTAEHLAFDWANNTLIATGRYNDVGKIVMKPVFKQGATSYIAEEIRYNFDSQRGVARKLVTKQDEAIIQCDKAKMDTEDTYYGDRIIYTTCNLHKPHYYIQARRVKFIQEKQVASGPFQFYFDDVPTPLGFFYGLFFLPKPKVSGTILPKFGETPQRGFFLREGGYYFYFNDYIDLALKGALYSKGPWSFKAESRYKKRYGYTGGIYYYRENDALIGEKILRKGKNITWHFKWQHHTAYNRISSFHAEVDIQGRPTGIPDNTDLQATTTSKIRYTNSLVGLPYTLSTSLAHSQNFQTKVTELVLPQLVLATSRIYLFRSRNETKKQWYEDISINHKFEFQNHLTNVINQDTLDISRLNIPKILQEAKYGVKHTVPLETNLKLFNYFNFSPFIQYTERWYWKRLDYKDDKSRDTIIADTIPRFSRVWEYSSGAQLNTTLYGTHFFSDNAWIKGMRHQLNPTIKFTYTPDFSGEKYGYWQQVSTRWGVEKKNRFDNFIYGAPLNRASAVLALEVDNALEIKVKNLRDAAEKPHKVPILESLNLSTSYDFKADSFKLNDINLKVRTRVIDSLISIEYDTTFDPYIYESCDPTHYQGKRKKRVEEFTWHHGQGLGHIKCSSLKISTTLKSPSSKQKDLAQESANKQIAQSLSFDSTQYVALSIPWGLRLTYTQIYSYQIEFDKKDIKRQLSFAGELGLTKKWSIIFSSIYDLDKKKLIGNATQIGIDRDMHCWQIKFLWCPLGERTSYEFSIGLKAPMLQDVKYERIGEHINL